MARARKTAQQDKIVSLIGQAISLDDTQDEQCFWNEIKRIKNKPRGKPRNLSADQLLEMNTASKLETMIRQISVDNDISLEQAEDLIGKSLLTLARQRVSMIFDRANRK